MSAPTAALPQLPLRHCYWVVPGLLLAGEHPGGSTRDKTKDRLKKLLAAGIECFVDLTKPTELLRYDTHLPFYVEYVRKAIKDHGLPGSREQMVEILDHVGNSMRAGRPVYVHCRAGIGRTGTVIGCLLVERGFSGDGALDELNRLWQQSKRSKSWAFVPETEAQANYVREWKPSLKNGGFEMTATASAVSGVGPISAAVDLRPGVLSVADVQSRAASQATGAGQARAAMRNLAAGKGRTGAKTSGANYVGGAGLSAAAAQARAAVERGEVSAHSTGAGSANGGGRSATASKARAAVEKEAHQARVADNGAAVERNGVSSGTTRVRAGGTSAAGAELAASATTQTSARIAGRAPSLRSNAGGAAPAPNQHPGAAQPPAVTGATWASQPPAPNYPSPASRSSGVPDALFTPSSETGPESMGAPHSAAVPDSTVGPASERVPASAGARHSGAIPGSALGLGSERVPPSAGAPHSAAVPPSVLGPGPERVRAAVVAATSPVVPGSAVGPERVSASAGASASAAIPGSVLAPTSALVAGLAERRADVDPLLDPATLVAARALRERFVGTLFGLAVGDAVAAATQFRRAGSFSPIGDMIGGGPFDLPRGAWSDDTAMALCLAESLLECSGFDARDQVQRYGRWQQEGYLSSTGQCVGITANTARSLAIAKWRRVVFPGSFDPEQLDPEPLSRVGSIALYYFASPETTLQQSAESSRTTCQAPAVLDACRQLGRALNAALSGQPKADILADVTPITEAAAHTNNTAATALAAAFWAFGSTDNFRDAVLHAANVGGNSDVVASVCGQLAGAHYGLSAIPPSWRNGLMHKDLIEGYADRLLAHGLISLSS